MFNTSHLNDVHNETSSIFKTDVLSESMEYLRLSVLTGKTIWTKRWITNIGQQLVNLLNVMSVNCFICTVGRTTVIH